MKKKLVRLTVRGVALETESQTPIVILRDDDNRTVLPVGVGPFEASAIIVEMEGIRPPRPLTHDLLARLFLRHGMKMRCLEIYTFLEGKYLSRIRYTKGFRKHTMEVRPSDGIALALRLGAEILATEEAIGIRGRESSLPVNLDAISDNILYLGSEKWNRAVM